MRQTNRHPLRRMLALLLVIVLCIGMIPAIPASAADVYVPDNVCGPIIKMDGVPYRYFGAELYWTNALGDQHVLHTIESLHILYCNDVNTGQNYYCYCIQPNLARSTYNYYPCIYSVAQ